MGQGRCQLSVVVPSYRGAASLPELLSRLGRVLDGLCLAFEVIVVDDASPDETAALAGRLLQQHPWLRYERLPVNGGQHAATVHGLRLAQGATLVTMDDDLQQAPESIPLLLAGLTPGVDVAIARFGRSAHPWLRRWASHAYRLLSQAGRARRIAITSFKAMRRPAVERLLAAVPPGQPFTLGVVLLATTAAARVVNVDVTHHPRRHGHSGYGWRSLLAMARQGLATRARLARR
jgi:glycosyltransferase involved in cell wall biosynthesis